MKNSIFTNLFSFFIIFNCQFSIGQNYLFKTLELEESIDSIINLANITTYFVDKNKATNIVKIQHHLKDGDFSLKEKIEFGGKYNRGLYSYWIHFSLANCNADSLALKFKYGKTDLIWLYQVIDNKLFKQQKSGSFTQLVYPSATLPNGNKNHTKITLPPFSKSDFFIQLKQFSGFNTTNDPQLFPIHKISENKPFQWAIYYCFIGGLFSMLTFLAIFTLLQFFQNKDKAFLFYSLYVITVMLHFSRTFGWENPFLNLFPQWFFCKHFYYTFAALPILFYYLFIQAFLNTPKNYPKVDFLIKLPVFIIPTIILVSQILLPINDIFVWKIFDFQKYIFGIYSILILTFLFKKENKLTHYVLAGSLMLLLGGFGANVLSFFDGLTSGFWNTPNLVSYGGVLLELLFFALGLGYKTKLAKEEKFQLEKEIQIKQQEAKQLSEINHIKDSFFANITHEFRTPLTIILGMTNQIKGHPTAKNMILENSQRLLNLVNKMLQLAKIESGNEPIYWKNGNVVIFLKYVTESFQSFALSKKISIHFYSHNSEIKMDFDEEKLQQILSNLISNSIKFTEEFGRIQVILRKIDFTLEIKVSDTGSGISTDKLPYIFDRFYQGRDNSKKQAEGTGIGLALTKELTELMGGTIHVNNEIEQGTEFILLFPITQNSEVLFTDFKLKPKLNFSNEVKTNPIISKLEKLPNPNGKPQILIIEDNRDVIRYLKIILRNDYEISTAKNGETGIKKAKNNIPDLIISDIMMPQTDGLTLCETLKNDEKTSHIPIILLTAKAALDDRILGLKTGADAYLVKPFEPKELFTRIEKLMELRTKLREKYSNILKGNFLKKLEKNSLDSEQNFLLKLYNILENNYRNEDFNTTRLCRKLGMNQTQFYRKIKAITNTTPALLFDLFAYKKLKN